MKKFFLFLLFIPIISCSNILSPGKEKANIDCPTVFFSSENNIFIYPDEDIAEIDNVNFKASLNNHGFVGDCYTDSVHNIYNLQLLILVEPLNPTNNNISLPIFLLFYDSNNQLIDKQYFRIKNNLNIDKETSEYIMTEIISDLNIFLNKDQEVKSVTIGFVKID